MKKRPNILMIITDDQGYWSLGCYGNKEIHTPNLDRLAESGLLFENFFCVSPVCSPARASIFTGKIPSAHGIHDWIHKGHAGEHELSQDLQEKLYDDHASWEYTQLKNQMKGDMPIDYLKGHTCFTELLSENGYFLGLSGKWHLGNSAKKQAGFDYWKTIAMGGDNYYYPTVLADNGQFEMLHGTYLTDYITDNAITFLDTARQREQPFYLSVHYTAPHSPWGKKHHPENVYSLYEACPFESVPDIPTHPWSIYKNQSPEEERSARFDNLKGYYTAITAMDRCVGSLLDYLEAHHLRENTIIFFTSDNGMSMGHHGIFGKGNGTFPLNMYDTAVKVPMIISYPGTILSSARNSNLFSHYDIFPTLVDYLDLKHEGDLSGLPGKSFSQILEGKEYTADSDIIIYDEYGPTRMIRTKEWKYIHRYPYGPHELYHIEVDPEETCNRIDDPEYGTIQKQLREKLDTWFCQYANPLLDGRGQSVYGYGQIGIGEYEKNFGL